MSENKPKRSQFFTNPLTGERTMGNLPRPHRPPTTEQLYQMYKDKLVKQGVATAEQIDELKKEHGIAATLNGMKGTPSNLEELVSGTEISTLLL